MNSGRLLTLREKNKQLLLCLANEPQFKEEIDFFLESTLFKIELTIFEGEGKIRAGSVVKIIHTKTNFYLSTFDHNEENALNRELSESLKDKAEDLDLLEQELLLELDTAQVEADLEREG